MTGFSIFAKGVTGIMLHLPGGVSTGVSLRKEGITELSTSTLLHKDRYESSPSVYHPMGKKLLFQDQSQMITTRYLFGILKPVKKPG